MTTHVFADSLGHGLKGEAKVREWCERTLSQRWEKVEQGQEWRGVDFIVTQLDGTRYAVEIKTDWVAQRTHNIFVETVSNDRTGRQGWAYTCSADLLLYYVTGEELVYVVEPVRLRQAVTRWAQRYPSRKVPNRGRAPGEDCCTHGVLVPMHEFESLALNVLSVG